MILQRNKIFILTLYLLLVCSTTWGSSRLPECDLLIDINIRNSRVDGILRVGVDKAKELRIRRGYIFINEGILNGKEVAINKRGRFIRIEADEPGYAEISFTGIFKDAKYTGDNYGVVPSVISNKGVSLAGGWHPAPEGLCWYNVRASLPSGYEAVSEAEEIIKLKQHDRIIFEFRFPYPREDVSLTAAKDFIIKKGQYRDIDIYAFFKEGNLKLADNYIEFTRKYLEMYEGLLGGYPYRRFSVVENFLPSGYSMPTLTLLGSSIVALPFIVETSLGHEILHQWFGNSVYVDDSQGNWSEGLTTYLADHYYRERKGEGWQYRKGILVNYMSYVRAERDFPLSEFQGRFDRASMAIGYGKAAMVFHMLRMMRNDEMFFSALRDLVREKIFSNASWLDIREAFERVYDTNLEGFFSQWTDAAGLPDISVNSVDVERTGSEYRLVFSIRQKERVYSIDIPLSIYLGNKVVNKSLHIAKKNQGFVFNLPDKPLRMVIDENYDIPRVISNGEYPPALSRIIENREAAVVLPEETGHVYKPVISELRSRGFKMIEVRDLKYEDMGKSSLFVLGADNPVAKLLFGDTGISREGFCIIVRENPWNQQEVVAVVNSDSEEEADVAFRKIFHYGKYSHLCFRNGRNLMKEMGDSTRGMVINLSDEVPAVDVSEVVTLEDIIERIRERRIIYVGEVHDVFAHHALQLDIISGIYKNKRKFAIGMEMFQRPFQPVLDRFISGKMGEREFLKESEYFRRWGFDYKLYKPILDFARSENIPVIAMNLERELIDRISSGGVDSLDDEERKRLPAELDFSDNDYRRRLREVFSRHKRSARKNFEYFYQSQILWDETMSESIDEFLKKNPEYSIAVLAGQGHIMYGSGIPRRTYRRNKLDYAIVLIDSEVEKGIADYVVFPKPVEGVPSPLLMVYLKEENGRFIISGFPEHSVSEKAGLKKGDVILSVDETEVTSIEEIRIHLLYKKHGETVRVRVMREENGRQEEMNIDVEL